MKIKNNTLYTFMVKGSTRLCYLTSLGFLGASLFLGGYIFFPTQASYALESSIQKEELSITKEENTVKDDITLDREYLAPHEKTWQGESDSFTTSLGHVLGLIYENSPYNVDALKEPFENLHKQVQKDIIPSLTEYSPYPRYSIDGMENNNIILKSSIQSGDTLSTLLEPWYGVSKVYAIVDKSKETYSLKSLKLGNTYKVVLDPVEDRLLEFRYEIDSTEQVVLKIKDDGFEINREAIVYDIRLQTVTATITSSIYNAVIAAGSNANLALKLTNMFSFDIDFTREVRVGDSFGAVVETRYRDGKFIGYGEVLGAYFINNKKRFDGYLFHDGDDPGNFTYYDSKGAALQKAFLKTPVRFTRVSSGYTMRRKHPILGIVRPHQGIDYAAPMGTPVVAVASGTVTKSQYSGGYGHLIILRHIGNLTSQYAHLSGYAKGVRSGAKVKQGQVIGYVGSTGLSTGPHLDFRIKKNGQFINPDHVIVPDKSPVKADKKEEFMTIVEQVNSYLDGTKDLTDYDKNTWLK